MVLWKEKGEEREREGRERVTHSKGGKRERRATFDDEIGDHSTLWSYSFPFRGRERERGQWKVWEWIERWNRERRLTITRHFPLLREEKSSLWGNIPMYVEDVYSRNGRLHVEVWRHIWEERKREMIPMERERVGEDRMNWLISLCQNEEWDSSDWGYSRYSDEVGRMNECAEWDEWWLMKQLMFQWCLLILYDDVFFFSFFRSQPCKYKQSLQLRMGRENEERSEKEGGMGEEESQIEEWEERRRRRGRRRKDNGIGIDKEGEHLREITLC